MGLFDKFSGKNKAAEQERIIAQQKEQEHQNAVEEQRKAHEGLPWPGVPKLNVLNVKDTRIAVEDPVPKDRKDEIGPLVYEPELSSDDIVDLTLQELLFLQLTLTIFNRKAPLANYERNHRVIYNEFLGRIHKAEKFYVLFDKKTGYPLIDGGFVPIYLERERAEQAAGFYRTQFRDCGVVERDGEAAPPREDGKTPIAFFDYLYYLGMENVVVDNGWYKGIIKRSEISAPIDWNMDPKKTPPSNPALAYAMIDYVSEVKWPVKYEKRDEIIKKKTDKMMSLIPGGKYLVPTQVSDADPDKLPANFSHDKPAKQVQLPAIKVNNKMYLPVFTDLFEYSKKFSGSDMKPTAFEYKHLVKFITGGVEGMIINPNGEGIIVPKEKAQSLLFVEAGKKSSSKNSKEAKSREDVSSSGDAAPSDTQES